MAIALMGVVLFVIGQCFLLLIGERWQIDEWSKGLYVVAKPMRILGAVIMGVGVVLLVLDAIS